MKFKPNYMMLKPQVRITGLKDLWNQTSAPHSALLCLLSFFFLTDTTHERSDGTGTGRRWMEGTQDMKQ